MKSKVTALVSIGFLFFSFIKPAVKPNPVKPNIVFFLVDDLGWTDLGCYGNKFHETPNIDKLAAESAKFTNAYAACAVCSPTRASIMTGKYPVRLKLTDWIPGVIYPNAPLKTPPIRYELPLEEEILPEVLKKNGYATFHIGKWHLGEDGRYFPLSQGFGVNIGGHSKGAPGSYFYPYKRTTPETDWSVRNMPSGGKEGDYLTEVLTDHAIKQLERHNKNKPFFLNMSYYQVHEPYEAKPEYIEKYKKKKEAMGLTRENPIYAAMHQSLDESVGRIIKKLTDLGMMDNTIIVFTSDNGGVDENDGNLPLRNGKGTYYEGGIRVPLLVRYPAITKDSQVCTPSVCSIDFMPTLLDLAGIKHKAKFDGVSFKSVLENPLSANLKRALYWHYPHYHSPIRPPTGAILEGDFKLIESLGDGKLELYDLKNDMSETTNIAEKQPELAQKMLKKLKKWQKSVKADMPTPNPKHDAKQPFAKPITAWNGENRYKLLK
jgi:arylsulfatase A